MNSFKWPGCEHVNKITCLTWIYPTRLLFSSLEWHIMWTSALINMLDVCKCMGGNASYALLRQRTRWDLNSSILLMVLFIQTVLMVRSGYFAPNARTHTILLVSAPTNQNQQDGPLYAGFWSANSKRVKVDLPTKRVIFKRVIVSVAVAKQKVGKPQT